ncbi:fumarylacetoacetate hydrolase family protein [Arthrobacter sp. Sa2BUA2]|uniref:Fumarylacetoacetate hydrolase family protein n=1 Tax=Arthrobacter pullicola TaxID=2762224 RepID=A0ABR8YKW1_9MICC|nr:fumarylacetoacetate hydrolase family protein [Arthrobacter pullicola]MBD8044870.1 fumarylacetoacetate hydrolase family protein [Arthrobacter pullicola]
MTYALITFADPATGESRTGLETGGRVLPLTAENLALPGGTPVSIETIIEHWDTAEPQLDRLAGEAGQAGTGAEGWLDFTELKVLVPLRPQQILQAGANYRKHVIDLAVAHRDGGGTDEEIRERTAEIMDKRAAEGTPYFFIGLPTAMASATEDLILPASGRSHDWELEVAAVIGSRAFRVSPEEALDHVFGYTMVNDITTREFVFRKDMPAIGSDWFRAKNAPGFLPTGPLVLPAKFVEDPQDLKVTLRLNGETMQDESTSDMIFTVAQLVSHASQQMPLLPGDLILTGSPAGNGAHWGRLLRDGDVMEGEITGLGTQLVRCKDEVAQ